FHRDPKPHSAIRERLRCRSGDGIGEVTIDLADVLLLADGQDATVTEHRSAKEQQYVEADPRDQRAQCQPGDWLALADARDRVKDNERSAGEHGADKQ